MTDDKITYPEEERYRELYKLLADRVNQEISVYWVRNSIMLAVNAGVITIAFAIDIHYPLSLCLFTIGILCSIIWLLVAIRARRWLYYWENRLADVEKRLPEPHLFPAYWEERKDRVKKGEPPAVTTLIFSLPIIFIIVWCIYIILMYLARNSI
jgi:hypothetical protein